MDNRTEIIEIKPKNMFIPICVAQAVCIAVILIAVLIIKFFFGGSYTKLQKWYGENILDETNVSEVFEEENSSEI